MADQINFSEYYKTLSHSALLEILGNPGSYQPLAIEAAKVEFNSRQLSDKEIKEAKQSLLTSQKEKEKEWEKVKMVETKIKTAQHVFLNTINPIKSGATSTEKSITLIIISFGSLFLYQVISNSRMLTYSFTRISVFDFRSFLIFIPYVIMPIAIFLFWKRITVGWILLIFFATHFLVLIFWMLIQNIGSSVIGSSEFDSLFRKPSAISFLIPLIIISGTLYVLCKPKLKEIFKIDNQKMITTITISSLLTVIIILIFI